MTPRNQPTVEDEKKVQEHFCWLTPSSIVIVPPTLVVRRNRRISCDTTCIHRQHEKYSLYKICIHWAARHLREPLEHCGWMTHIEAEVGWVVVWLADVLAALEVVEHVGGGPVVDHLPLAQQDQAVEHAEHRVPAKKRWRGD